MKEQYLEDLAVGQTFGTGVKRSKDETPTKPCPTGKWAFCTNFAGIAILLKLQCSMELH
ncbi:MAG: hypothetical protein M3Y55_13680 [Pseudomonadota bacterium]|nr:hypothetical protein [Pseudomonadota bacterium]